jgi:transposase
VRVAGDPNVTLRGLARVPPYSPDLNPIEQVFAKIKHSMRRAMERTVEAAQDRLVSVLDTIPPSECANYFSGAGYAAT